MRPAAVFVLVLAASVSYLTQFIRSGWVPHDEGLLGQSAERVLVGERPHADFDDPYTGGQAYLHALAFVLGGARLSSMRWVLFIFSIPYVIALWWIARRALSPGWAASVVGAAVVWTLPNYFASLPSWYNLFFALFGLAALLRWLETRRSSWIVIAGLCGGLSILMKISGLFFVAAAFLVVLHAEDADQRRSGSTLVMIASALAALFPIAIVAKRLSLNAFAHFVVPAMLVSLVVGLDAWRRGAAPPRILLRRVALLAAGVVAPLALFAAPYAAAGELRALFNGVFVLPQQRLSFATFDLPPLVMSIAALPLLLALLPGHSRGARISAIAIGIAALAAVPFSSDAPLYDLVWAAARSFLLGLAIVAAYLLIRFPSDGARRSELIAVLAVASFCTLIQFPYAFAIYFCYVAPLVLLATVYLMRYRASMDVGDIAFPFSPAALAFVSAFAIVWLNTSRISTFGVRYEPRSPTTLLLPQRANLHVPSVHAVAYTEIVRLIEQHASSDFIDAFPDCPEVPFLARKRSPNRGFYDFFSADERGQIRPDVNLIVINAIPEFSAPVDAQLTATLRQRFPEGRQIGPFEVRWKNKER